MSETVLLICNIAIFLLLLVGFFSLFRSLFLRESVKKSMERIYTNLASKDSKRLDKLEEERRKYGSLTGTDGGSFARFLEKIDNMLIYSGWSIRHTWLNTSSFLLLYVVCGGTLFLVTLVLGGGFLLAAVLVILAGSIPIILMSHDANKAYASVESQMVLCINMVANMGDATDSIIVVLEQVAPFMTSTLRTAMRRAISTANLSGKESDGIRQLCREVEHPLFVQFIRHLEVSARNSADFRTVARDFSDQAEKAINNANKQREIFRGGRGSILSLMVVGLIMIYMLATFDGRGLFVVLAEMSGSMLGCLILLYQVVVYVAAVLYITLGMRR